MKRIWSTVLAAVLLAGLLSVGMMPAAAETIYSWNGITVTCTEDTLTISGTGEIDVYACKDIQSVLGYREIKTVIIEEGVTNIPIDLFVAKYGRPSITSVTIPSSVTSIGRSAFRDCTTLTSVTIADGVTSIGMRAFENCAALTSLTLPDSVTNIGQGAFYGCSSLANVKISNSVTNIESGTFSNCLSLTDVTIPNGVTSVEASAFSGCISLKSVTLPNGVTSIGNEAFEGCASLKSVTIPDGVTSIGEGAFSGCKALPSVTIPESVTHIGESLFGYDRPPTIYCRCQSIAHLYAQRNYIPFEATHAFAGGRCSRCGLTSDSATTAPVGNTGTRGNTTAPVESTGAPTSTAPNGQSDTGVPEPTPDIRENSEPQTAGVNSDVSSDASLPGARTKSPYWVLYGALAVLAAGAAVTIVVIVRKKKAK